MKAGMEHRVPLSEQVLRLLEAASALREDSGLVFPSPLKPGVPMSDMTLTKVLRSVGLAKRATVHGFRSSFKNWTLEQTDTPWVVSEAALAHSLGNSTEQAYARSDLFERRRTLMQQWGDYVTSSCDSSSNRKGRARSPAVWFLTSLSLGLSNSPVATGRDSTQADMSLVLHLTAEGPILTGLGNSPSCILL